MSRHAANGNAITGNGRSQAHPPPAATALVDDAGTVVGWSSGAQRLLGYAGEEVLDRHVGLLLSTAPPEGPRGSAWARELHAMGGLRHLRSREHWSWLVGARHKDGRTVPVALDASPLTTSGHGAGWLLSAVDLSALHAAPDAARLLTDALLDQAPIAFAIWDTDLRAVWLNDSAAAQASGPRDAIVNRHVDEAGENFDLTDAMPALRGVLETGTPVIDHEIRRRQASGGERAFSVSMFRLEGDDGVPLGLCTMGIDASESHVRSQMSLLSSAGTRIGTTLDIATTAQELADVAVPALADFATVDLSDWRPAGSSPQERLYDNEFGSPTFRRAGASSVNPGVPEAVFKVGDVVFLPPTSPIVRPLSTGRSHFEPRLNTGQSWLVDDPARHEAIKRARMHSAMIVPLMARGEILGVAVFARTRNQTSFTRDDLFLAEELCARAALSLDNARRYSRERSAALALQGDLLPARLPDGTGLDLYHRYLPTDRQGVGGDWYDVIPLPNGRVGLVVGDVVGHGINAAAAMGRLRTAVNTLADQCLPPHELLARLDHVAVRLSRGAYDPRHLGIPPLAATCLYAVHDRTTGRCTIARAGHPPPLIIDPDGRAEFIHAPAGAPIGWGLSSYESVDVDIAENGFLAMYTDGLVERRGEDIDAGMDRLTAAFTAAVGQAGGDLDDIGDAVIDRMTRGTRPEDDIALLLARVQESAAGGRAAPLEPC
ncbi:SpoIIE family protein phosphatase [Streptomyces sp. NBC_01198]|uniref:SpoIIE family protein phosphatase n=1 Tax=Streptomyces sp. NBC_01198 TaxID=2903769 RepID=UPI002E13CEAC|nr:SpoIIE family protein phosphatase [Streptomyces sp. NBC_01198]